MIFIKKFCSNPLILLQLRFKVDGYLVVADNPTIEDEFIHRDRVGEGFIVGRVRWIVNKIK